MMSSKGKEVDRQEQTEEAAEGSASSAKSSVTLQVCVQPHLQLPNLASKDFIPLVSAHPTLLQIFLFLVCREHISIVLLSKNGDFYSGRCEDLSPRPKEP